MKTIEFGLGLHGGAGAREKTPADRENTEKQVVSLRRYAAIGKEMLVDNVPPRDVVVEMVTQMENDEVFNAGKGASLRRSADNPTDPTIRLDAALMTYPDINGNSKFAGVHGINVIQNPILVAQALHDQLPANMPSESRYGQRLARQVVEEVDLEPLQPEDLMTEYRRTRWNEHLEEVAKAEQKGTILEPEKGDTVGAFAYRYVYEDGVLQEDPTANDFSQVAAAGSTGGPVGVDEYRISDLINPGVGIYASALGAGCVTGTGEYFMNYAHAKDIVRYFALTDHGRVSAAKFMRDKLRLNGTKGGVIFCALDVNDHMRVGAAHNTSLMPHALWHSDENVIAYGSAIPTSSTLPDATRLYFKSTRS